MAGSSPPLVAPPSIAVDVEWTPGARVAPAARAAVERELAALALVLSEFEADVDALARRASCGLDWLLPRLELNLPVPASRRAFRIRFARLDRTEITVRTREGAVLAVVRLT